jgi:hypothetical protein
VAYNQTLHRLSTLFWQSQIATSFAKLKRLKYVSIARKDATAVRRRRRTVPEPTFLRPAQYIIGACQNWLSARVRRCFFLWKAGIPTTKSNLVVLGRFFDKWNCYFAVHKLSRLTANRFYTLISPFACSVRKTKLLDRWNHWKIISVGIGKRSLLWRCWRHWKTYLCMMQRRRQLVRLQHGFSALQNNRILFQKRNWTLASKLYLTACQYRLRRLFCIWKIGRRIRHGLLKLNKVGRVRLYFHRWQAGCVTGDVRLRLTLETAVVDHRYSPTKNSRSSPRSSRSPSQVVAHSPFQDSLAQSLLSTANSVVSQNSFHNWVGHDVKDFVDPFPGDRSPTARNRVDRTKGLQKQVPDSKGVRLFRSGSRL